MRRTIKRNHQLQRSNQKTEKENQPAMACFLCTLQLTAAAPQVVSLLEELFCKGGVPPHLLTFHPLALRLIHRQKT